MSLTTCQTDRCAHHGHPEFCFAVAERVPEEDVAFLRDTLEGMVAGGAVFSHGQTIQMGCGLLLVAASADQTLRLLEPDFVSRPLSWREAVSQTLANLRLQRDTGASYLELGRLAFPAIFDTCIICTRFAQAQQVLMERHGELPPRSGWFLGCLDDDHDHGAVAELEVVSLYEAMLRNPRVLPYLALPAGALLSIGRPTAIVFCDGKLLSPGAGSLEARLAAEGARQSGRT